MQLRVIWRYFIAMLFKDLTPLSLHPHVDFIPLRLGHQRQKGVALMVSPIQAFAKTDHR
jgi:hypothetical protein